ncbi:replication fork protection component Swi3-domain-containing protein [Russula emetica]|nr:replication fork protection component Swi3-domain-containing protein [Russula emetica]
MDTDINDIWDLPLENSVNNPDGEGPTPSPASNPPLFLPSDDEEDAVPNANARNDANNPNPDIDALFEGLDDIDDSFQELAPALDLDALRREADARNARAVRAELGANIPAGAEPSTAATAAAAKTKTNGGRGGGVLDGLDGDGEDDGKKKRKPLPKLDETRLLGKDGFPQLLKDTKNFKPKGKGHEAMDLDRVLQIYQFWSHKLYPKTRFKETVDRVEKLCHSKRMQVALSVWRDEAKGLVNGVRLPTADDDDNDSDEDSEADGAPRDNETARAAAATADEDAATSSTSPPSSPARSRLRHSDGGGGVFSATSDSDRDSDTPHLSSDASRPPSSSSPPDRDEAAIELDALLEAEATASSHGSGTHNVASTGHAWKATSNADADVIAMDEDEDLWDALDLDTGAVASAPATTTTPAPPAMDDDQEMWDIVHELEQEKAKENAHRPDPPVQVPPAASDTQPETDDLDDLYL